MTHKEAIREAVAQATDKQEPRIVVRHRMPPCRWSQGGWTWRVYSLHCEAAQELRPNDPDNLVILTVEA